MHGVRHHPLIRRLAMSRIRSFLTSRIAIVSMFVLLGGAIYIASLPKSDAIFALGVCTYYKDATYKKVVGARGTGCCGSVINWGVTSAFVKCERIYCTDQICPN
jgi:hypothetical protein